MPSCGSESMCVSVCVCVWGGGGGGVEPESGAGSIVNELESGRGGEKHC